MQEEETTHLPEVRKIGMDAPMLWLARGMDDFRKIPGPCLTYGAGLAAISAAIAVTLFLTNQITWILVLAGGFLIIAPMLAMGAYQAARMLQSGETPSLKDMLVVSSAFRKDLIILGIMLFIFYGIWIEAAHLTYGLSTSTIHKSVGAFLSFMFTDPAGIRMALIGTLIGGVIAFLAYSLVVISAPMLLNEERDAFIATITSVRTVTRNFFPMLLWAVLIAILTMIGIATAFLGLIVIFPWIGLASWHAYRDLVPSSDEDIIKIV